MLLARADTRPVRLLCNHSGVLPPGRAMVVCFKLPDCFGHCYQYGRSAGPLHTVDSWSGRNADQKLTNMSSWAYRLSPRPPSCVPPSTADLSGLNSPTSGIRVTWSDTAHSA